MATRLITITVNGTAHTIEIEPHQTLVEVLRTKLWLTGPREACGQGVCGTCTVLVGDRPVSSCLMLALDADGQEVTTVEGLDRDGHLHIIQEMFVEHLAFQCGYCTPGMVMMTKCLLSEKPHPTPAEIKDYMTGNLCRCGGYGEITKAILAASDRMAVKEETV